jgi:formate hydrogenlyase subunit 3/multisubunit Na+/H+ antiporter MnhD subunit
MGSDDAGLVLSGDVRRRRCRRGEAGWVYLVATHVGTAFLLALFILLGRASGTQDFASYAVPAGSAGTLFLLALIGFGTKAGLFPFHVWLPEAHPAAPSPVSAVMSGVMIKTGIYGIVRALVLLGAVPGWCGWAVLAIGAVSGVLGVLFALAQHDLKRLLAYHSVENVGIIALGLGIGMLGVQAGSPVVAALGFAGGLLHVLNHALFKGLLFLGAGAVVHGAGTRHLERLGGLLKRMPWTGATFLVGSVAICGLPPFNGFASEFLVYAGSFKSILSSGAAALGGVLAVVALALIGGLAAACFAKAFGIVFLGEPRTAVAAAAHEVDGTMRGPMLILAALCLAIGMGAGAVVRFMEPAVAALTGAEAGPTAADWLSPIAAVAAGLIAATAALALIRRRLLAGRSRRETVTWDCGYAAPTARHAIHGHGFRPTVDPRCGIPAASRTSNNGCPKASFPPPPACHDETPDLARERLYDPISAPGARLGLGAQIAARASSLVRVVRRRDGTGSFDVGVAVMNAVSVFHPLLAIVAAPLLFGAINRTKAFFAGRCGPPLLQTYFDLWKLFRKGATYSRTTTWIFRAGPLVNFACLLAALTLVPLGHVAAPLAFGGDLILLRIAGLGTVLHGRGGARRRLELRRHGREPRRCSSRRSPSRPCWSA